MNTNANKKGEELNYLPPRSRLVGLSDVTLFKLVRIQRTKFLTPINPSSLLTALSVIFNYFMGILFREYILLL